MTKYIIKNLELAIAKLNTVTASTLQSEGLNDQEMGIIYKFVLGAWLAAEGMKINGDECLPEKESKDFDDLLEMCPFPFFVKICRGEYE